MTIGRRQFLASTLVAPALLTRRAFAWAPDAPVLERPFARATKEGEGLYVTLATPAGGPQCLSNGGVLAGRDAVLLIEGTCSRPARRSSSTWRGSSRTGRFAAP